MSVSDQSLKRARDVAAEVVVAYDDKYFPLFEILEEEVKRRESKRKSLARDLDIDTIVRRRARRRNPRTDHPARGVRS